MTDVQPFAPDTELVGVSPASGSSEAAGEPPRSRSGRATRRPTSWPDRLLAVGATVPVVVIVATLVLVAVLSFREQGRPEGALTFGNYAEVYGNSFVYRALVNTVVMVVITVVSALMIGVPLAWLVERTDLGFKRTIYLLMVVRLLIPGFLTAIGWIFMFHPRTGIVNGWFADAPGLSWISFNVVSLLGMGVVQGIALSALVFVMVSGTLRTMDSSLEEAARMAGAGTWQILRRVTLPLMVPSLFGATLFVGAVAIAAFDIPLIIGLSDNIVVFSTYVFLVSSPVQGLPDYGAAAATSTLLILVALVFSHWYTRVLSRARRYEVITGKAYRPSIVELGRWRGPLRTAVAFYFFISTFLPLVFIVWVSLIPFVQPPSGASVRQVSLANYEALDWGRLRQSIWNTMRLMVVAPTLTLLFSVLLSWVVLRSKLRRRAAYDFVAFMPQAVPNIIFALAGLLVALYWTRGWYDLYGSLTLVIAVTAIVFIAFATRMINGALIQISAELEEAAAMSGASTLAIIRRITLPLLKPVLLFSWLWLAMLAFRELTIPTLLGRGGNDTVSVVAWSAWQIGRAGQASAISIVMLLLLAPILVVYLWLTRADRSAGAQPIRRPRRAEKGTS